MHKNEENMDLEYNVKGTKFLKYLRILVLTDEIIRA